MKKILIIILFLMIVFSVQSTSNIDFIVAKVGREIILYSELVQQKTQMRTAGMYRDDMDDLLILENMIENKLIVQKARELNIRADERRIANAVDNQFNNIKSQFPTEEDFYRELRNAGLLQSDLKKYYEDGFTEQFLRERLIQTEIRSKINIANTELIDLYNAEKESLPQKPETYELAMILRIPGPSPETERLAREKIEGINTRIKSGEDFGQLAQEFSECPSAAVMGDLGYFSRGMMVPEFDEAAFKLNLDEVSEIIRTQFGYHIIKLTNRRNDEIRASHILVLLEESADDILREKELMQDIYEQLEQGQDFASLAILYSQDEETRANNGIIGHLTRNQFPSFFVNELSDLQPSQHSRVLEHQNMLYIFSIYQAFEPRPFLFEEITEELTELLYTKKQIDLYEHWIEDLKTEIFVQIYSDRLVTEVDKNDIVTDD